VHESELRLEILLRPLGVPVTIGLRGRHHQNVLHFFFLLSILAPGLVRFHGVVGSNVGFSTSLEVFFAAAVEKQVDVTSSLADPSYCGATAEDDMTKRVDG
jgi:hypothetical protein